MYFGGRKDLDDPEYKSMLNSPKDGSAPPKPSDVRNGDLVSLLLAATPPYLYNMPLVPQTFFFSEMLRSFVQAKADRQNVKSHQVHRRRKRTWREATPPKPCPDMDKPLELTTQRTPEKSPSPVAKRSAPSCEFTAEKLANSSVAPEGGSGGDAPLPAPPLWYPNIYPNQPPYPIDPLHFFIDLRVSAHIWDRKLNAEGSQSGSSKEPSPSATSPLNLADFKENSDKVDLSRCRNNSAFSVPERHQESSSGENFERSKHSVHYFMSNLKKIYSTPLEDREKDKPTGQEDGKKSSNDLRAVIGLELVVDYVKQESDVSEEEEEDGDGGEDAYQRVEEEGEVGEEEEYHSVGAEDKEQSS